MTYGLPDDAVHMIAATTYGENRGQGDSAIIHTASSVFNRLGQHEWSNMSIPQVLHSGFSAVNNTSNNDGFNEAMSGKFKDKASENEFKNIYSKVAAINRGTLEPTDTQFYFKQPEINKLIKHKQFDFSKVEEGEPFKTKAGKFRTFHYK